MIIFLSSYFLICDLLDDPVPELYKEMSRELSLRWEIPCCYFEEDDEEKLDLVVRLEGAQGREWRDKFVSDFPTHPEEGDFVVVAEGVRLDRALVEDLIPSTWYTFRVRVMARGHSVLSQVAFFHTSPCAPDPPAPPTALSDEKEAGNVKVMWTPPFGNGASVDSFVLLMRVVVVEKGEEGVERVGEWRVVYQGSRSETSLPIPKVKRLVGVHFKVAGVSRRGRSSFSNSCNLTTSSHPSLIPPLSHWTHHLTAKEQGSLSFLAPSYTDLEVEGVESKSLFQVARVVQESLPFSVNLGVIAKCVRSSASDYYQTKNET